MESLYPLMNIVGPVVLLAVIIFFTVRTWKRSPREKQISDEGARRLRQQLNDEDTQRPNGSR
ncbi:MAG: hypothetical protein EOP13_00510 [Pseudomonas sp.]|uniref:hypothetical protein n=1 Tax=Pseudomonas sp. TaxID=306 RepID=UPI0011F7B378|nr:hypothetical protein [Pseudomonas sp.]RZI76998.1 MAG: hypothetical protein EOP13_00510 [Pseudomonas sp.]